MNVKVCRNCLQTLSQDRRERGLLVCANCAKAIQALKEKEKEKEKQVAEANPLQAALKSEKQKILEEEAQRVENEKKQKNVEHFFEDFSKVKRSFW
jgi:uncharacterized Zn finger protein (UPF0148 family)